MFPGSNVSFVAPATLPDGQDAVLKISLSGEYESEHEADALEHWAGAGAALLYDRHGDALLLERCVPGHDLWELPEKEALPVSAAVARRLWRPALPGPFRTLADEAARWAEELPGWPFEPQLVEEAVAACRALGPSQGEQVLVHQDLHGGNIVSAQREPWLAIDPKPLVGEREFGLVSLVRDRRPCDEATIRRRLDFYASELGLDRERLRRWSLVHALAWGFEDGEVYEEMIDCARILARL